MQAKEQLASRIIRAMHENLLERREKNPSYSLRAYARDLGLAPAALSQILNGKRGVTRRTGEKILCRLPKSHLQSPEALNQLRGRSLLSPSAKKDWSPIDAEAFRAVSEWQHYAILSLAETKDFKSDPQWIAHRLALPVKVIRRSIETLISLEMLKRNSSGELEATGAQYTSTHEMVNLALRRAHIEGLELASQAINEVSLEQRDFSFMVMASNPHRLQKAKKMIRDFRRSLCKFLEDTDDKSEVYRLGVQLFPVTKRKVPL
jgi:uncharacterized protein (TIGR02147 family)